LLDYFAKNRLGAKTARLESVDLLRGIVMILMALDHVRDFMGRPGISPTDLTQATVSLFFTRWVTNICAPVFFILTASARIFRCDEMPPTAKCTGCSNRPAWANIRLRRRPDGRFGLLMIYVIWAFVVIALYPLCAWYARLKQRTGSAWLSYL
jgi:hypothetical protein